MTLSISTFSIIILSKMTLIITALDIALGVANKPTMLSVIILNVTVLNVMAPFLFVLII
jgi:hypothetical protein